MAALTGPELLLDVALTLDAEHTRRASMLPRLYGVHPDGRYDQIDEGDPYRMLELFVLLPDESYVALALVCTGWASPMEDEPVRPSKHPHRARIRTVTVMDATGEEVTVLARAGCDPEIVHGGEGGLVDALRRACARLGDGGADTPTAA